MSKILLLTLLRDTQISAFEICDACIASQTYKDFKWVVFNVSHARVSSKAADDIIRRDTANWSDLLNITIKRYPADHVMFIDAQAWYTPTYLMSMQHWLDIVPIVGEGISRNYNFKYNVYREIRNIDSVWLYGTGVQYNAIPKLQVAVEPAFKHANIRVWTELRNVGYIIPEWNGSVRLTYSAKNGKGRYQPDVDFTKLRNWCGCDTDSITELFTQGFLEDYDALC